MQKEKDSYREMAEMQKQHDASIKFKVRCHGPPSSSFQATAPHACSHILAFTHPRISVGYCKA